MLWFGLVAVGQIHGGFSIGADISPTDIAQAIMTAIFLSTSCLVK